MISERKNSNDLYCRNDDQYVEDDDFHNGDSKVTAKKKSSKEIIISFLTRYVTPVIVQRFLNFPFQR